VTPGSWRRGRRNIASPGSSSSSSTSNLRIPAATPPPSPPPPPPAPLGCEPPRPPDHARLNQRWLCVKESGGGDKESARSIGTRSMSFLSPLGRRWSSLLSRRWSSLLPAS
jgi:hypothetical protein